MARRSCRAPGTVGKRVASNSFNAFRESPSRLSKLRPSVRVCSPTRRPWTTRATTASASIDELEQLIDAGATVIDVREHEERDEGYIPGSRNVPYRLMRTCCPDLPNDRPIVTICNSGPRAAIAASILRTKGLDARPVARSVGVPESVLALERVYSRPLAHDPLFWTWGIISRRLTVMSTRASGHS